MKKHYLTVIIFISAICVTNVKSQGLDKLDFFIGKWALTTYDVMPDGNTAKGHGTSTVFKILDNTALQDDFRMLDEKDNVVFRGTSIRSFNKRTGKYQIAWIMPGTYGITDIVAEWIDGKLISTGKGYDASGEFLERFEYYDITKDSYKFSMDRSYDNGKSWIKDFSRIEATRTE